MSKFDGMSITERIATATQEEIEAAKKLCEERDDWAENWVGYLEEIA